MSGEQVEELVAVLLCRKFPTATLVRPSKGDGGLDVVVTGHADGIEVYQVKKFARNLAAAQKTQIKNSLSRLEEHRVEQGLAVREWHVTMPLNPTNENLKWLAEVTADVAYPCDWRGLNFVDGLAAEFPDVIDYYLHDGADRLAAVVSQLTAAMGMKPKADAAGFLSPGQIVDYLASVQPLLDSDPHFRYEVTIGPFRDSVASEPGLIVAMTQGTPGPSGSSVTVKVFPRFAAALDFRPIPINLVVKTELGSDLHKSLEDFTKFGTPFHAPDGTVDGDLDLPGDLGGSFQGGSIRVGPPTDAAGGYVIRLATLDPIGNVVGSVIMDMQPPSTGLDRTGVRAHGTDRSRVLDVEILTDLTGGNMNFKVSSGDLTGRRPGDVIGSLRFLRSMQPPNGLAVAQELGPITTPPMDLGSVGDWLDPDAIDRQLGVLEVLAELQDWTSVQIVVPPVNAIDADTVWRWRAATRLFRGEAITLGQSSTRFCLHAGGKPPEGKFALASVMDASITVGDQVVELGKMITHSPAAEVVPDSVTEHDDHLDVTVRTADGVNPTARLEGVKDEAEKA